MAQGLTDRETDIMQDYDLANTYAVKYIVPFLVQLNARGLMLNSAMQKFAKFLTLPETNSRAQAIFEMAFAMLAVAVPALGLAKMLEESQKAGQSPRHLAINARR